jgi:hypothetical protein
MIYKVKIHRWKSGRLEKLEHEITDLRYLAILLKEGYHSAKVYDNIGRLIDSYGSEVEEELGEIYA